MSSLFWEEAKLDIVWESPEFFVRTMEYAMPAPAFAGPDCYDEGFGFFFYDQGVFDLKLQGQGHIIDPTCLIFNHQHDEWEVEVHPDEVVRGCDIVVTESFLRQLLPQFDHNSEIKLPIPRANTSYSISQLYQRLHQEIGQGNSKLLIESLIVTLCADTVWHFLAPSGERDAARHPSDSEIEIIECAKKFLSEHVASDISLQSLAQHVGLSPYHLLRLFKSRTGQTPHQHLTHARINLAKQLLRSTDEGITQIAYRIGYQNPSHFAKQFRRQTGLNPRQFRTNA